MTRINEVPSPRSAEFKEATANCALKEASSLGLISEGQKNQLFRIVSERKIGNSALDGAAIASIFERFAHSMKGGVLSSPQQAQLLRIMLALYCAEGYAEIEERFFFKLGDFVLESFKCASSLSIHFHNETIVLLKETLERKNLDPVVKNYIGQMASFIVHHPQITLNNQLILIGMMNFSKTRALYDYIMLPYAKMSPQNSALKLLFKGFDSLPMTSLKERSEVLSYFESIFRNKQIDLVFKEAIKEVLELRIKDSSESVSFIEKSAEVLSVYDLASMG